MPQQLPDSGTTQEHQPKQGRNRPHRRNPLLLLYHRPHRRNAHPAQVVGLANDRCDGENIHGQLKSGRNAPHAPAGDLLILHAGGDLNSNWAYMGRRRTRLEHQVLARGDDAPRRRPGHLHPYGVQRFLDTITRIPAMVATHARCSNGGGPIRARSYAAIRQASPDRQLVQVASTTTPPLGGAPVMAA